jgi:metallo-beta-lactamase family protein
MKIKFCGASREVTGSSHLITLDDGFQILLDCGLYQGRSKDMEDFNSNWLFDPQSLDVVILSHGHIDHTGRLPKLYKDGFKGPIYTTHATRSLCSIMLLDSAMIQNKDTEYINKRRIKKNGEEDILLKEPLYSVEDAEEVMNQFVSVSYEKWIQIHPKVRILFRDAGHILGSASVALEIQEGDRLIRFGFTGDIGRPNRPILKDPIPMEPMDFLICESTYGHKEHEMRSTEIEHFLHIIKTTCVDQKGKLLIPAFSIGRTQEIVHLLDQLENEGLLPKIPVYVDSPLAVNATAIYNAHPECYDKAMRNYLAMDSNPFGFNTLHYNKDLEVSKSLNTTNEPCIIISASGMMNAGRVKHHLYHSISNPNNTLLIVGYCSPETPGGKLREGATQIKLFGEEKAVKMRVEIMDSFSAHADRSEMLDFLRPQRKSLQKMFLVHGTYDRQLLFKDYLEQYGFSNIEIPTLMQEFLI